MIPVSYFRVLLVYPNLSMMLTPSYAVGLFTSVLKKKGYTIALFDCTPYSSQVEFCGEPLAVTRANKLLNSRQFDAKALLGDPKTDLKGDFKKTLDAFKPHAVIISTLVEDTWPQAQELLDILFEYPEIQHIIGGVFCTMAPEIVMAHRTVRCIGVGEGEETVVEFCETVRSGKAPLEIKGTWTREASGKVTRNPSRPLVNINAILPNFSLFDERRFYRPLGANIWKTFPIETYRGCPYSCAFCNSPQQVVIAKENEQGNYLRRKSIDTLHREMAIMIERHKVEFFYINDDAFMARPKAEMMNFIKMYEEFKLPFWFQTRFEDIDEEKLWALKEVGCFRISFGLEHGNEKYRKEKLYRNTSNQMILEQSSTVAKVEIPYTLNTLIGMPYETRELFFDTVHLIREIRSWDALSVNIFVPYHRTLLREMAIKEGWLDPNRQTTSVIAESILRMPKPYLQPDEILVLQHVIPLYCRFEQSRWPEIQEVERTWKTEEGQACFKELSKEWYIMTYGTQEKDRMLTYQG